uniref:Uncharacterized protein n=1 Tax=Panagrolaimus davidi TaxID=227884 RepID=A0A914PVH7_9BILA
MSSKLLLNRYFWDKLPSDYLDELRIFYKNFAEEKKSLKEISVPNSISSLSPEFDFAVIDYYRLDKFRKSLQFSEEFSMSPLAKEVKELAKHIPEINAAFGNEKKWFNLILLGIYSVYCRIFPTDFAMFENYKRLAKKHGKIYVSWLKPFDFEISREKTPKTAVPVSLFSTVKYIPSKQIRHFQETKEIHGKIAFPGPIIYYIRKYANSYILEKLFQTCKYFFFLQPTPFCHRFIFSDSFKETKFNYISLGTSSTAKIVPKKLFIQNALHVSQQSDKFALSKFLPNFYKLEIKFLRIHNQKLTKNEFEFIVKEGRIEIMELSDVFIYENDAIAKNEVESDKGEVNAPATEDEKLVVLEDIIKFCPKIKEFYSSPTAISPNTAQFLQNFKFENAIKKFKTCEIDGFFDLDSYCNFIKTKIEIRGKVLVSFSTKVDRQEALNFIEEFKQKFYCITTNFAFVPIGNI